MSNTDPTRPADSSGGRRQRVSKDSPARLRRLAVAVLALRRHLRSTPVAVPRGASRAHTARALGSCLGLSESLAAAALGVLEQRGDLAFGGGTLVAVPPGEPHPDDLDITILIQETALAYDPGQVLPHGLIALDAGVETAQVRRAARPLIWSGLLQWRPRGPHGLSTDSGTSG
ncbi:hypothetical protein [Streptomyces sp. H27-H5]|uniref:hypothetical protein n=1 Tax=Streptomyces sp. H27-H5 TaxID=2996460 RepID=UPI00227071C3|nr:hypothetical protein [Streptomyces sp. H27-H5]MCY0963291.1 hypothetical protein [Streptomyces sp. H27-H5]